VRRGALAKAKWLRIAFALLVLIGCIAAEAQNVTASPSSLSFGNQAQGTKSPLQKVILKNEQTSAITITSISTSLSAFGQTNNCPASPARLGPGGSCMISVSFTPGSTGSFTDSLTIVDTGMSSPQTVALSGTGIAALTSIAVTPSTATVIAGNTQQFTATGTYSDGTTQNLTSTATWKSSNVAVATVNSSGLATGAEKGTTTISAKSGAIAGTATLSVTLAVLTSISVTPANASLAAGQTQQFTATGTYSNGTTQNLTNLAKWSSSATSVAAINGSGLATSIAQGTTTITAQGLGVSGSTTLTVAPLVLTSIAVSPSAASIAAGYTQAFTATGTYSNGTTQNLTSTVQWSSSLASVASISSGGVASGIAQGTAGISASSGTIGGSAVLTVTAPALTSITITPASASIALGTTQQFTATGNYSDGSTQNLTSIANWSSSATAVATIAAGGSATSVAVGTTTITAASGSVSAQVTLTVGAPVLVSLAVTPASPSLALGTTQQFTATGTYSNGSTLNLTNSVTWSTGAGSVAAVNAQGLCSTAALGSTSVTAASGSVSGSTNIAVTPAQLVSIAVTPAIPTISTGATLQFVATGTFTDGSTQNVNGTVQWNSDTLTTATINAQGLVTSVGAGTANISASTGTVTGSTTLTVTSATIESIAVVPTTPSGALGTIQPFTATGTFSDGTTQNLTSTATWSSSLDSTATINAAGVATNVGIGSATITATWEGISGSTLLTVTPATLESITINPPTAAIPLGTTQQFTATGTFTDGTTQDVTQSGQWSSSAATVATVSNTAGNAGLATTLGAGTTTIGITSGSVNGSATLLVSPAALVSIAITPQAPSIALGTTQQFTATGTYTDSSTQDLTSVVTWSSSNAMVAIIGNTAGSYGLATSSGQGVATITATSGSVSSNTTLTVGSAALVSIAVSPANAAVPLGGNQQFVATGTYSDNSTQDLTSSAAWSSSSTSVATVTSGLASGVSTGATTISASSGSITGSAVLSVTPGALALGTVSAVTQVTCPAEATNYGWVSEKPNGSPVTICYTANVSCPNVPDLGITYGVATPSGTSNGTAIFVSPKGGTQPVGGNLANNMPYELYHANYQTIQMAWDSDWRDGATGGGYFKSAACRPATMLSYFNTTYYQTAVNAPTAGSCAVSFSGGAAALGYSLTYYGASFLDKAIFVSGPHYSNLIDGCVPSAAPVSVCPSSDGVTYPMGCNTMAETWTEPGQYTGGAANELGQQIGDNPPCNVKSHVYTATDEANLTADSLVDQAPDSSFNYPQTAISAYECDDDVNWGNPSETQAWLYFAQIANPTQVAGGCSYQNTAQPAACLAVNRVYGCQSTEAAYSGYVCVGNTCPVCTGNPPSCTCAGVACSGSYAEPAILLADFEDPVNGCIKRH